MSRYSYRTLTKVSIDFRKELKYQIPWKYVRCQISINLWLMHDAAPPHVLSAVREFLEKVFPEQWIGQGGPTFWSARLWFKSLRYLSLWTSKVYCLCYRSQWHTRPATTNKECIWNNSYDTWNFPASQVIRVQTCNLLGYNLEVDTLNISSNLQQAAIRKICFSRSMLTKHFLFVLCCRFTFRRFAHAVFCYPLHTT
jgi:hypothetical protein